MERSFAVVEDGRVVNIVVGVEQEILDAHPDKYIEYTDGWHFPEGIDGGAFFPAPAPAASEEEAVS